MSKLKILIVDDSQLNREILSCMLEDKYDICEAENGKQAVEILERCHKDFKLVLLDLIMPVMDGYQVLAVMKEKQWLDMLPVICISSEASEDSIRHLIMQRNRTLNTMKDRHCIKGTCEVITCSQSINPTDAIFGSL